MPARLLKVGVFTCDETSSLQLGIWQAKEAPGLLPSRPGLSTTLLLRSSEARGLPSLLLRVGLCRLATLLLLLPRKDELFTMVQRKPGVLNLARFSCKLGLARSLFWSDDFGKFVVKCCSLGEFLGPRLVRPDSSWPKGSPITRLASLEEARCSHLCVLELSRGASVIFMVWMASRVDSKTLWQRLIWLAEATCPCCET